MKCFFKLSLAIMCLVVANIGCMPRREAPKLEPPKVTVAKPIVREVQDFDDYTGRVDAVETVEVRARVSGYLLEVKFKDGDLVKEGDLLFEIDPSTYKAAYEQANAQIGIWKAKLKFESSQVVRNEKLVQTSAVTKEEYESSIAQRDEAAASLIASEADARAKKVDLDFTKIYSPITGRIDRTFVTKGNLVQSSGAEPTLLTRIVTTDPMYVYFDIDERNLLKYINARQAERKSSEPENLRDRKLPARITLSNGEVYAEPGLIDFASNRIDPNTGTISIRATVQNSNLQLRPGMFVRVQIGAQSKPYQALMVAERAIGTDQSEKFVYVVDGENKAQRRRVVLGAKRGRLRVITSGLDSSDSVVVNGLMQVRPDSPVTVQPGEMPDNADGEQPVLAPSENSTTNAKE